MTYTHITYASGEQKQKREITEAQLIKIMSGAMLLMQHGDDSIEWRCIEDPDDDRIIRYEMTQRSPVRNTQGPGVFIHHYIPNGEVHEDD